MDWSEFFKMGGYAFYVWSSWGLTFIVLLWLYIQPKLKAAKIKQQLKREHSRRDKIASSNTVD